MSAMPERDVRQTPRVRLTYDDLVRLPDDGVRHELIDGEHYVTPAPGIPHQVVVANITIRLGIHLLAHPVGLVIGGPDVVLDAHNKLEPDVVYLSHERARLVTKTQYLDGAPELVVEVSSRSTRRYDQTTKLEAYDRIGVSEYWFVDMDAATVSIYRRHTSDGRFAAPLRVHGSASILTTPLLPGLQLSLADVFDNLGLARSPLERP
jgi:Uma2 family endonuclease